MKYDVIGKDFRDIVPEHYCYYESFENAMTERNIATYETIETMFPRNPAHPYIVRFFESAFRDETWTYSDTITDFIDSLAIKEGLNIVRYSNGNFGLMAYYGSHENGLEVLNIADNETYWKLIEDIDENNF